MFLLSLNKRHIFRNICIFYTKLLVLVDNSDSYKIFASTRTLGISWEICNSVVHYVQQVLLIFNYLGCSETTGKKQSYTVQCTVVCFPLLTDIFSEQNHPRDRWKDSDCGCGWQQGRRTGRAAGPARRRLLAWVHTVGLVRHKPMR